MTIKEKYSAKNMAEKIISKVNKAFGKDYNSKVALLKPISQYNDEWNEYNPVLILIDKDFNEVDHNIGVYDLIPDNEDQWKYAEENDDDMLELEDITVKF